MFSCALIICVQSSPMNIRAFFPFKNPVPAICNSLGSGNYDEQNEVTKHLVDNLYTCLKSNMETPEQYVN